MSDIYLPVAAFVIICVIIIILLITVIGLSILLLKMKSKVYKQLIEQGESSTTINGNRYNYNFHNKESEDLLTNVTKKLNFDEPCLVKPCSVTVIRKVEPEDQTDSTSDKKHEQNAMVLPKTIYAREQIARLCTEIMSSKNPDYFRESHELKDLSNKKKTSVRKSALDRSMSTPELDIYDVVPQRTTPVLDYNNHMEEDAEYSLPRSDSKVILDIDTGYYMPISLKCKTYANASLK